MIPNSKKIKNSILIKGDCLDVMKYLPDGKIDMVLCDLPYGSTVCNWDKYVPMDKLWEHYNRLLKPQCSVILFANGLFTPRVMLSNLKDYKYRYVWIKKNSTNFVHAKNRPMTKSEDILVFSKAPMGHISQLGDKRMKYNPQGLIPVNKVRKSGKSNFTGTVAGKRPSHKDEFLVEYTNYPTDVLMDFPEDSPNKKLHTSQKPVDLLKFLIKTYTDEGGIVLDNCMGSGSTCVASELCGRKSVGIEIKEKYFNIAVKRIEELI